jgi:hypothetical protein
MFFGASEPLAIAECVRAFIAKEHKFSRSDCRQQARQFSAERFRTQFTAAVDSTIARCRIETFTGNSDLVPPRMIA